MKKSGSRPSALSLAVWPLTAMGLAFCLIKNEQVSAYLNFDIITISLLVISIILIFINHISIYMKSDEN